LVTISNPQTHAVYSTVPAETRSVTVSEEGYTISITEQENGDVVITGLEELNAPMTELLSGALSIWKWGIVPVEA